MARIVMLTSVHQPFDTRIFQKEARSLAQAGHEVVLVVPHIAAEVRDGVRIHPLRPISGRLGRMLVMPWRVFRAALSLNGDVYHFHDPELIPIGLLLKLWGRRVIYDVHEDVPRALLGKAYLPRWSRRGLAFLVGGFERMAARAFDRVILAREDILESFHGHPRLTLIRNFPMRCMFAHRPEARPADGEFALAYVGGLTQIRGPVEMVAALELVDPAVEVRLDVYGTFWPESLEREVRALPGMRRVRYHGQVSYAQLPDLLARAHAGIVCFLPSPNNVNSGPTKLFEYMASGLPVVASDFPLWRKVIEETGCGVVVDPTDPRAIAAGIERLARDPAARQGMAANGRRAIQERFNWESEAARLVIAYEDLLAH